MKLLTITVPTVLLGVAVSTFAQNTAGNLQTCLSGKYPALCDHSTLSSEQAKEARAAENRENLQLCLIGKYPVLCNHVLLTSEQAKAVSAAEAKVASSRTSRTVAAPTPKTKSKGCVSGLSIESVEGDGKVIKLDDGSMWEVDDVDTMDTALWLATEDVVLCDGKIINTDDKESADVTPIRRGASGAEGHGRAPSYIIEASANDETFVINGEVFKAQTYCFNFGKGDRVKFIEGSPLGACASAKLLNLRTEEMCEVWCGD